MWARMIEGKTPEWSRVAVDVLLGAAIVTIAWFSRTTGSSTFVTWDEPAWVFRSVRFFQALGRGDLAGTMLVGHPGVVTMWIGACGLAWQRFITHALSPAQWVAAASVPALQVHDATTIRHLVALLPAAKTFLPLVHALLALATWLLLARLLGRSWALAATLFVILDPYGLALSRVLHIDALAAQFMLLSLLAALVHGQAAPRVHKPRSPFLLLSGVAAGLAALTKAYGVLVGPGVALVLAVAQMSRCTGHPGSRRAVLPLLAHWARDLLLWGGVAAGTFVALWPAMWVAPLSTVRGILGLSLEYATRPGDATAAFFRGQVVTDPGVWFYPLTMFFRATPALLVGIPLVLIGLVVPRTSAAPEDRARRGVSAALLVYVLLYLAIITASRKKFDRYMLPALLAADLMAALGWLLAIHGLWRALGRSLANARRLGSALVALLILAQATVLLGPLYPAHYLAYYNPWAGGAERATETIPVGWGEGIEQVARYLANKENAQQTIVATWAVAGVAPFFPGQVLKPTAGALAQADYVLFTIGDRQAQDPLLAGFSQPEFVVTLNGTAYAWLYANDYDQNLAREIGESDAVVVANLPSSLQQYPSLDYRVIVGDTEEQVAQALGSATQGTEVLYYLEFDNVSDHPEMWIRRQLAQSALLLGEKPFIYGRLSRYRLPVDARFVAAEPVAQPPLVFGQQLRLEGHQLAFRQVQYRQQVGVGLTWSPLGSLEEDYHLFLRLVDEEGRIWGKRDGPLQDEALLRSSAWTVQNDYLCRYTVPLDPGLPPGPYWLALGVYRLDDLSRLEIRDEGGRSRGTELRIGPLEVIHPLVPPATEELDIPHPLTARLGDEVELLGYDLADRAYRSGEDMPLALFWRCLADVGEHYELLLRLVRDGSTVAQWRALPAGVHYPTERWLRGDLLRYPQRLRIAPDAATGDYDLTMNWVNAQGETLAAEDILLARVQIEHQDRLFTVPPIQFPYPARVGDQAELLGYALSHTSIERGGSLRLTLYWRALGPTETSYSVFTHLLDPANIIRGQRDSVPAGGARPMTGWVEGEIIVDAYDIVVASDAPPGPHRIEIGVYDPANSQRLPVFGADGASIAESRILFDQAIEVR